MRLNTKLLQRIVKQAVNEHKELEALRKEVIRVMGPIMDTNIQLVALAESVNDRVAVLDRTGRSSHLNFQPATLLPFVNHGSPEVRKMSANLLPQRFLTHLKFDHDSAVRAAVARRTDMQSVKEMMRRFPHDDELKTIFRRKKKQLNEAGLPDPKVNDEEFDIHGDAPLGDAVKQGDAPGLSDGWYDLTAFKICQQYDNNMELNWEEQTVNNLVKHTKATSGVEIDKDKLLKKVLDMIKDREDRALERDALKELAASLRSDDELLEESASYDETPDPVEALVGSRLSPGDYVQEANKLFQVREYQLPQAIKKFRIGEHALVKVQMVPTKAKLPHASGPRAIDEQALDLYVRHWNSHQALSGEPLQLEWSGHPESANAISFNVTLK